MDAYTVVKAIGRGSFGKALLCRTREAGELVVIKQIDIDHIAEKERAEALNEVDVMAALSHPSIVRFRGSFEEGGCLHIVMDYAQGGDLGTLIQQRLSCKPVKLFTEEIAQGLAHMHEKGILHRDVKTSNIFLSDDLTRAQIGDFGIAKVLGSKSFASTAIGTPYYLSPEICDEKPYGEKSDVWSLGCVAFEMVTFKHAFEGSSLPALVIKILRGECSPLPKSCSPGLRQIISSMLSRDPRMRPTASRLAAILAASPALNPPARSQPVTRKTPPRPQAASCPATPRDTASPPEPVVHSARRRIVAVPTLEDELVSAKVHIKEPVPHQAHIKAPRTTTSRSSVATPRRSVSSPAAAAPEKFTHVTEPRPNKGQPKKLRLSEDSAAPAPPLPPACSPVDPPPVPSPAREAAPVKKKKKKKTPDRVVASESSSPVTSPPGSPRSTRKGIRKSVDVPATARDRADQRDHEQQFQKMLRGVKAKVSLSEPPFASRSQHPPTSPSCVDGHDENVIILTKEQKKSGRAISASSTPPRARSPVVEPSSASNPSTPYPSSQAPSKKKSLSPGPVSPISARRQNVPSPTAPRPATASGGSEAHLQRALENLQRLDQILKSFVSDGNGSTPQQPTGDREIQQPRASAEQHIESLREKLESSLGEEVFRRAYTFVRQRGPDSDSSVVIELFGQQTVELLTELIHYEDLVYTH